ncbi:MAG: hypothetical protein DHS20C14_04830 [Phycisphaeraceae bacterium]|nr:MAG: hypothetical protein DHS20C14_04830 [Phycisphaeraceae bacterium]
MSERDPTEGFGVLHVVEPGWAAGTREGGSDAALLACAAHRLAETPGPRDVCVVGTDAALRTVRELDMNPIGVIPRRLTPRATFDRPARPGSPTHHGTELLWHAGTRGPVSSGAASVLRAFSPPTPHLLARARRARHVEVLTEPDRLAWADVGIGAAIVDPPDLAPLAASRRAHDQAARRRLDVDGTIMLCPIGDRPSAIDARQFGFLLGLLAVSGRNISGLLAREALHGPLARRHINALHEPCRVFEAEVSSLAVLGVADLALVPPSVTQGSGADLIITRWCEALGVPIVHWGQVAPGKLRHTPGLAGPVIEAIERSRAGEVPSTLAG